MRHQRDTHGQQGENAETDQEIVAMKGGDGGLQRARAMSQAQAPKFRFFVDRRHSEPVSMGRPSSPARAGGRRDRHLERPSSSGRESAYHLTQHFPAQPHQADIHIGLSLMRGFGAELKNDLPFSPLSNNGAAVVESIHARRLGPAGHTAEIALDERRKYFVLNL